VEATRNAIGCPKVLVAGKENRRPVVVDGPVQIVRLRVFERATNVPVGSTGRGREGSCRTLVTGGGEGAAGTSGIGDVAIGREHPAVASTVTKRNAAVRGGATTSDYRRTRPNGHGPKDGHRIAPTRPRVWMATG
jgi:hypothetical protein